MTTTAISVNDGAQVTIGDLIGNPLWIPTKILDLLANRFLSQVLLRNGGPNTNGLVGYHESTPLYLDTDPDVRAVAEFAEIPVAAGSVGTPAITVALKKALGIRISKEMRDEGRIGEVTRQILQLTNTMVRADERALRAVLESPSIPTIAATAAWGTTNARVRRDISNAMEVIGSAKPATSTQGDDTFGFQADTIAMPASIAPLLLDDDRFLSVYKDSLAPDSIAYTGRMPRDIMGLAGLTSRSWPANKVLVVERGTVGFYSDTRLLQVTPLYGEGGGPNGGPTESWRADASRKRAMAADQPLAACWITGVV
jgi:hypothetical protein